VIDKSQTIPDESYASDDSNESPPTDIVAYNELRSCADLFRMENKGILDIQPDFQRDFVWNPADQTRFIDSLIKQLPIPSMCFSLDYKTQKWLVIDGLQRLSTIIRFLKGSDWKLSKLDDINPEIAGKSCALIKDESSSLHAYYQRVENLTLPITVLRCDYSKKTHMEYLFTIFHRLNSGGMKLTNQEIRNCIYGGSFNDLLKTLDSLPSWRRVNKMKKDENYRLVKQELILRFFAFTSRLNKYTGSLSKFLNDYMQDHRSDSSNLLEERKILFTRVTDILSKKLFADQVPIKLSVTMLEALLVGIGSNVDFLETKNHNEIAGLFSRLGEDESFRDEKVLEGTSKTKRVKDRLNAANRIFSGQ
jgi:hypothetical protein